ncbi:DUF928 domain-containing protein [Kovacikia minuta]|uniref:DUF928 domain-containing protein n=1 Tax=Kovacikia minuta TaxID=2931930 RepID=UPI0020C8242E|nr:DUF928 domain-containing protein [Kovacikia minuta]
MEGTIHRVVQDRAIAAQIESASPQQKVELYAQNGIWFDALTTLANLRLANPQDPALTSDWDSLLRSVGLEDVVTAPLVK